MSDAHGRTRDLDAWLAPFLAVLGRKTRRVWAAALPSRSVRPWQRKSLQPMAARLELASHDQLQHFIASTAWDDSAAWAVLAHEADRLVGGPCAFLVIDDTALPPQPFHPLRRRNLGLLRPSRASCRAAWPGSDAASWASAICAGRSASRASRRSTALACSSCRRRVVLGTWCRTRSHVRQRSSWPR